MKCNTFIKGATLIEALVASIISVSVIAGVVMIMMQNASLNTKSTVRADAYSKLNFVSRQIELKIKQGAVLNFPNDTAILISDYNNVFVIGFKIVDGKLLRCNSSSVSQGDFSAVTANCSFAGSKFNKTANNTYAEYILKLKTYDSNNNLKFATNPFTFYAKCRSLYSL